MEHQKKEVESEELLKDIILKKLGSIKHKKFSEKVVDEFSLAFRVFLLKHLKLDYEFTEDELSGELNKRRVNKELKERILALANFLADMKYQEKKVAREEFEKLLEESIQIVNLATMLKEKREEAAAAKKNGNNKNLLKIFLEKFSKNKEKMENPSAGLKDIERELNSISSIVKLRSRLSDIRGKHAKWCSKRMDEVSKTVNELKKSIEHNHDNLKILRENYNKSKENLERAAGNDNKQADLLLKGIEAKYEKKRNLLNAHISGRIALLGYLKQRLEYLKSIGLLAELAEDREPGLISKLNKRLRGLEHEKSRIKSELRDIPRDISKFSKDILREERAAKEAETLLKRVEIDEYMEELRAAFSRERKSSTENMDKALADFYTSLYRAYFELEECDMDEALKYYKEAVKHYSNAKKQKQRIMYYDLVDLYQQVYQRRKVLREF